ncbi:uncharacterized protein [Drosophila kikkawai]|uniref:CKLF-like MARVEL transmembrane domain-containing protein 4 n=1 Tax=Drosophila kikkawai TaxID=30033 RepID=A0A6P4HQS2_DROKI|nr:uncharacterized protein LOC108071871 [Drosophila kikkawai]
MPDKKKSKSKKKSPSKKDKKSKSKQAQQLEKLAQICRGIAVFDLLHALYFTVQTIIDLVQQFSAVGLLALVGVGFWVVVVLLLIVGLWKRRPNLVRYWLLFSMSGFIVDILFLLWGLATSITVDWDRLEEFVIIFIGIFIESASIYVIYRYYKIINTKGKKLCCNKSSDKKSPKKGKKDGKKKSRKK